MTPMSSEPPEHHLSDPCSCENHDEKVDVEGPFFPRDQKKESQREEERRVEGEKGKDETNMTASLREK